MDAEKAFTFIAAIVAVASIVMVTAWTLDRSTEFKHKNTQAVRDMLGKTDMMGRSNRGNAMIEAKKDESVISTLLACPFCGCDPVTHNWQYECREFMQCGSIGCNSCGIQIKWDDIRTKKRWDITGELRAIAKWNTRAG